MSPRDFALRPALAAGAPAAAAATRAASTLDWTPLIVALIGATGVVVAAVLARSARAKEQGPHAAAEILEAWKDVVETLQHERDVAIDERELALKEVDRMRGEVERAVGEKALAVSELRACRRHDHGDLT